MANYTNSQKLAAVLSEWARPAISQIASSKIAELPFMMSLQSTIDGLGIVGNGYSIVSDISPFIQPVIDSMITPMMERYFKNIPDEAIPKTARAIVEQMKTQKNVSLLNGLLVLEPSDVEELEKLLAKNLPITDDESYKVIH